MPEKTSTSSPNSRQPCSSCVRLRTCPDLPGLTLTHAVESTRSQPRHAHDSLVLGVVLAGARRIETATETALAAEGWCFALAPGVAHACCPQPSCSYLAVSLAPESLPESFGDMLASRQTLRPSPVCFEAPQLAAALLRLAEAVEEASGVLERQSLLAECLEVLVARTAGPQAETGPDGETGPHAEPGPLVKAVARARALLSEQLVEGAGTLGLEDLAQACGVGAFALHRAFSREVGLPPHAFQTHLRLRRAKELLRAGVPLSEAALAAGFCDQSHMNRHFARLVGLTPAQYARAFAEPENESR